MESSRLTYPDRFYTVAAYAPHKDEAIVGSPSPSLLWDEPFPSSVTATAATAGGMGQLLLMCSFGGRIIPCSTGKSLCYLCGEIQIMAVNQHASRADIHACLSRLLLGGRPVMLKYQVPTLLAVAAARSSAPRLASPPCPRLASPPLLRGATNCARAPASTPRPHARRSGAISALPQAGFNADGAILARILAAVFVPKSSPRILALPHRTFGVSTAITAMTSPCPRNHHGGQIPPRFLDSTVQVRALDPPWRPICPHPPKPYPAPLLSPQCASTSGNLSQIWRSSIVAGECSLNLPHITAVHS